VSWWIVAWLAVGSWALSASGVMMLSRRGQPPRGLTTAGELLPAAILGALAAVYTFTQAGALVIDARVVGLVCTAGAMWLRAPFVVVVMTAMVGTAVARLLGAT
jgi:branched-subunit amino acid transport protein AzlD